MSPFNRAHIDWCSIITMALSRVISEIFNVETLKSQSRVNEGHGKWCKNRMRPIIPGSNSHNLRSAQLKDCYSNSYYTLLTSCNMLNKLTCFFAHCFNLFSQFYFDSTVQITRHINQDTKIMQYRWIQSGQNSTSIYLHHVHRK